MDYTELRSKVDNMVDGADIQPGPHAGENRDKVREKGIRRHFKAVAAEAARLIAAEERKALAALRHGLTEMEDRVVLAMAHES